MRRVMFNIFDYDLFLHVTFHVLGVEMGLLVVYKVGIPIEKFNLYLRFPLFGT